MTKRKTFAPDDAEAMRLRDEAAFNWGCCKSCGDLFLLFTWHDFVRGAALCGRCQQPVELEDEPSWPKEGRWTTP